MRGLPIPPAADKPGSVPGTTASATDKGKDKESPGVDGVVNGIAAAGTGVGADVSGEPETGPKLASSLPDRDLYGAQGSDFVAPSPVPPATSPRLDDDADGSSKAEMDSVATGSSDTGVSSEIERETAASGSGTATGGASTSAGSAAKSLLAPLATAERVRRSSDSGLRHKASDSSVPASSAASVALELDSGATTTTNVNTPTAATTDQDSVDSDLYRIKADALHVEHAHTASAAAATRSRSHTTSRYGPARPQDTANGGVATNGPAPPPLEVLLYRGAQECPICFLYYPNYLNETRCCKQSICTECFVQIKRADPHPPYNSGTSDAARAGPQSTSGTATETLVSEPAACPYCQMTDFGVLYRQSPFRSGIPVPSARSFGRSLFSSSSSASISTQKGLSSNPPVITTDHIRPDWSIKLTAARHHLARRSAAANALHASAFLAHNPEVAASSSSRRSSRSSSATSLLSFKKDKIKAKANRLRGMSSSKLGPNAGNTSASGSGSGAAGSSSAAAAAAASTTRSSSSTDSRAPSQSPAPRASDSSSSQPASVASPSAAAEARRNDQIVINEVIRLSLADQPSSDHKHTATSSSTTLRT